jgi:hypothetical protein
MLVDFIEAVKIVAQCAAELVGFCLLFALAALVTFVVSENNANRRNNVV